MAWSGHEGIGLRAAFDASGFDASWAIGIDDQFRQRPVGFWRLQPSQRVDEADAMGADPLALGGLDGDQTDQVVDQHEDHHFLENGLDLVALEDIHAEGDFQIAQVHLHLPPQAVQPGNLRGGVAFGIQQCGYQGHLSHATAGFSDTELELATSSVSGNAANCSGIIHLGRVWGLRHSTS